MLNSKATNAQKARDMDPIELYRKVTTRIRSMGNYNSRRIDHRPLVMADLREGKPVVVVRGGFKWEGEFLRPGTVWHPGMELLPHVAAILAMPGINLVTKDFYDIDKKKKELEAIAAKLTPLYSAVGTYRSQVNQEHAAVQAAQRAMEEAKRAIKEHQREAEQAEKNLAAADQALKDFVAGLDFEI